MTTTLPTNSLSTDEYVKRRASTLENAAAEGLAGLLVCARGGGSLERYADLMYLADFYSPFPTIPDVPANWSGRGLAFLVMREDGRCLLVSDTDSRGRDGLPDDAARFGDDVLNLLVEALDELSLRRARIGLVGTDAVPFATIEALRARCPELQLTVADHVTKRLRAIKSPAEIERLRAASELGSRMLDAMMAAARPGVTHGDILAAGLQVLIPAGGILYNAFMGSGRGGSEGYCVSSRLPTWAAETPLADGDWFTAGISGVYRDYYFDLARSRTAGRATDKEIEAFEASIASVDASIDASRPGVSVDEVAKAGLGEQERRGFPVAGAFNGMGHGIGLGWDDPWLVPGENSPLEPGMVLCVERGLSKDGFEADFEETILVSEGAPVVLTSARRRYW